MTQRDVSRDVSPCIFYRRFGWKVEQTAGVDTLHELGVREFGHEVLPTKSKWWDENQTPVVFFVVSCIVGRKNSMVLNVITLLGTNISH